MDMAKQALGTDYYGFYAQGPLAGIPPGPSIASNASKPLAVELARYKVSPEKMRKELWWLQGRTYKRGNVTSLALNEGESYILPAGCGKSPTNANRLVHILSIVERENILITTAGNLDYHTAARLIIVNWPRDPKRREGLETQLLMEHIAPPTRPTVPEQFS